MEALQFKEWKEQNREVFARQFSEHFGSQRHEWYDFVEQQYARYLACFRKGLV